jgi:hypothetical protein
MKKKKLPSKQITNKNELKDVNSSGISLGPLVYAIYFLAFSFLLIVLNYTVNIPYFEKFRVSPVFFASFVVLFWVFKFLLQITRASIFPLLFSQFLTVVLNIILDKWYLSNPAMLGFISEYMFYISIFSTLLSFLITATFLIFAALRRK